MIFFFFYKPHSKFYINATINPLYLICFCNISLRVHAQSNKARDWNPDPVYIGIIVTIFTFRFILSYVIFYYCFQHFFRSSRAPSDRRARMIHGSPSGGLDPTILKSFPVLTFSDVTAIRPHLGPLECVVCLSPFEDVDTLRLLPKCDHVFHVHCVDTWLAAHTTCPLCRASLEPPPDESAEVDSGRVDESRSVTGTGDIDMARNDVVEVWREINMEGHFGKYIRWNSTGHVALGGGLVWDSERYTLRLPEDVRNDLLNGKLHRSRSCIITLEVG